MLEIGSVGARLYAQFDEGGFDRFQRRLNKAKTETRTPTVAHLDTKADTSGAARYEASLTKATHATKAHGAEAKRTHGILSAMTRGPGGLLAMAGGFYGVERATKAVLGQFRESQRVGRQTNAVLTSTHQAAGITAKEIGNLATAISKKSGIDDEAIQSGENLLLTFTNIRNEAGKGNDVFSRGTKVVTDMSVALGQDMKSSAIQVGKALNDPIKGVTALQRVGVSFTQQQKDQIKTLVESGHRLDAQKLILRELNKEFGGSAAKTATNSAKLKVAFGNLEEQIGGKLAPVIDRVAGKLTPFVQGMVDGTGAGGRFAAKAKHIATEVYDVGKQFVQAGGGVGKFFLHHPELVKVAATAAGIAGSVKVISKLGNLTGLTGLLKLATGVGAKGGLGGILRGAKPVPVFVTNNLPGGGGGVNPIVRTAEDVAGGAAGAEVAGGTAGAIATAGGGLFAAGGLGLAAYGLGKLGATQYHSASAADIHGLNAGVGVHPATYNPQTGSLTVAVPAGLPAGPALKAVGAEVQAVTSKTVEAQRAVKAWETSLRGLSPAPITVLRTASVEAVKAMSGATLTTKDLDAVIRSANRGAFGAMSTAVADSASKVEHLRDRLSHLDRGSSAYRATARQLRTAQSNLNDELTQAYKAGLRGAGGLAALGGGAASASDAVGNAAQTIADNVNQLASKLQGQGIHFTAARTRVGRRTQVAAFGGLGDAAGALLPHTGGKVAGLLARAQRFATGWVGSRGERGDDAVPALLGRGEAVLNRHQQAVIEGFLGNGFLDNLFATVQTPHYLASGGHVPDVGIAGPPGALRSDANAASRLMDHAAERYIGKLWDAPVQRMVRFGRAQAAKHMPYVYGGGHGSFSGPYDCSGFVSAILHAGGLLGSPITTDGLKNFGAAGDGGRVTIGVRGSTGRSAHTMMKVGSTYFESGGSGGGAHEMSGWDGSFPIHRHPAGFAKGGRPRVALRELPPWLRARILEHPELVDPDSPQFLGFGLAGGGRIARFAKGGFAKAKRLGHGAAVAAHLGNPASIGGGFSGWEARIGRAEADYGQMDRRYGQSEEDFVVEDATGAHVDQGAVNHRVRELAGLALQRQNIAAMYRSYLVAIKAAVKHYRDAIDRIKRAKAAVPVIKGKSKTAKRSRAQATKLRQGYTDRLNAYRQRLDELLGTRESVKDDLTDSNLDLGDLAKELATIAPGGSALALPADPGTSDPGSPDSGGGTPDPGTPDPGTPDTGTPDPSTPSADDIAAAAAAQVAAFQSSRADLFRTYGSNVVTPQALARMVAGGATADEGAAGTRYLGGASSGSDGGVLAGAGGDVNLNVTFTGPQPADPHTFTQTALHELKAAI